MQPSQKEIKEMQKLSKCFFISMKLGLTGLCQQAGKNKQIMYKMTRREHWITTALKYTKKVGDFFLLRNFLRQTK